MGRWGGGAFTQSPQGAVVVKRMSLLDKDEKLRYIHFWIINCRFLFNYARCYLNTFCNFFVYNVKH